jgi:hypothetical protein
VVTDAQPEYQFFMKDHLGNVRMTFTTKDEVETFEATIENPGKEASDFKNYNHTDRDLFDHTDAGSQYTFAQMLHGGSESYPSFVTFETIKFQS